MANIGKLRFNYRGLWVSGTAYKKDDVVKYGTGYYICNTDNSSTTSPRSRLTTNADRPGFAGTHWTLLSSTYNANRNETGAQKMDYSGSTAVNRTNAMWTAGTYYYGNMVTYRDTDHILRTYMCKVTSTTSTPTSTSNWDVVSTGQGDPQSHCDLTVERPFAEGGYFEPDKMYITCRFDRLFISNKLNINKFELFGKNYNNNKIELLSDHLAIKAELEA